MASFITTAVVVVCVISGVQAETGFSKKETDVNLFYQWYEEEPFVFEYEPSNSTISQYVVWETPSSERVAEQSNYTYYTVGDIGMVRNAQLNISKVTSQTRGVYICYVYNNVTDDGASILPVDRLLFGINYSDAKYRNKGDKYHRNLITAGIASAVFLFIGSVVVFTHACSYEVRMEKRHKHEVNGHNGVVNGGKGRGIKVAYVYDNQEFGTQL